MERLIFHMKIALFSLTIEICQYTIDGQLLATYSNGEIAGKITGVCPRNILQVANKQPYNNSGHVRKQAGGYVWKFADESEVM